MRRNRLIRTIPCIFAVLGVLSVAAGCSHTAQKAAPTAPVASAPALTQAGSAPAAVPPTSFQPYTVLPPPAAPPAITHHHRVLHLTRVHERVYLEDTDRHLYETGRDSQGHLCPIYRDPVTHAAYPLYYDPARDNYYRLARTDDGQFCRNYVGQPENDYYRSDRDYERILPSEADQPVITGVDDIPASDHHSSHHNNDWLWAIPVVIGAYFLLQPHHHSSPSPPAPTVIVRQQTPVTIINQNRSVVYYPIQVSAQPHGQQPHLPIPRQPTVHTFSAAGIRHFPGKTAPARLTIHPKMYATAVAPSVVMPRPVRAAPRTQSPQNRPAPHRVRVHPAFHPRIAPKRIARSAQSRPLPAIAVKRPMTIPAITRVMRHLSPHPANRAPRPSYVKPLEKVQPAVVRRPGPTPPRPVPMRRPTPVRRPTVIPNQAVKPHPKD